MSPSGLSNTHQACHAADMPSPAVAIPDQRTSKAKAESVLLRRRLQGGYDAKCAAVARPRTGQVFHPEKPVQQGCISNMTPQQGNDVLGRCRRVHRQECRRGLTPGSPKPPLHMLTVLKCHFHPSTILNNKGKLQALL